jgi:hypothetical protein
VTEPCAPDELSAIALYGARRLLLVLHAAGAVVLLGAATHHAIAMGRWLRGRIDGLAAEKTWARVVAVAYVVTFTLGAIVYPSYRYHVRGLYLDRHAPFFAGLFDVKEVFASLTLVVAVGLGALSFTLRPREEAHLARIYAVMSLIVCAVVWLDAIAGVIVTSVRGIG